MSSYYYLLAQLPYLVYGQALPMESAAFRDLAGEKLSERDAALLGLCSLDPDPLVTPGKASYAEKAAPCSSAFINNWREWERALRLNLARSRSQKEKREGDAPVDPPADPADAVSVAKAAAAISSPLDAEVFLDKARWDAISAFAGHDYFGVNTVYAYLLKLLLMERRGLFKAEEGFTEYKALYASIMEAARGEGSGGFQSETSIESGVAT